MGFTPCKADQPQQGMELREKETKKKIKYTVYLCAAEFWILAVRGKKLLK